MLTSLRTGWIPLKAGNMAEQNPLKRGHGSSSGASRPIFWSCGCRLWGGSGRRWCWIERRCLCFFGNRLVRRINHRFTPSLTRRNAPGGRRTYIWLRLFNKSNLDGRESAPLLRTDRHALKQVNADGEDNRGNDHDPPKPARVEVGDRPGMPIERMKSRRRRRVVKFRFVVRKSVFHIDLTTIMTRTGCGVCAGAGRRITTPCRTEATAVSRPGLPVERKTSVRRTVRDESTHRSTPTR